MIFLKVRCARLERRESLDHDFSEGALRAAREAERLDHDFSKGARRRDAAGVAGLVCGRVVDSVLEPSKDYTRRVAHTSD